MHKTLYEIFKIFFKIGTLLLGGGYVILPLLQSELVEKKHWLEYDDLCEYYTLSQSLPGLIGINTAIFVGYRLRGQLGAIISTFAMILPAFLAIILLATLFMEIANIELVKHVFYGIGIGVILLLILAIKETWTKCVIDKFTCYIFLGAFILSSCFKISPAIIVILAAISGIIYRKFNKNIDKELNEEETVGECVK